MSDMAGMAMSTATSTATAATATSTAMSMSMGSASTCKISMLWNWNVKNACFLSRSWHITSNGMFAASCIGVAFLVVSLELLRRLSREYDVFILRQFQRNIAAASPDYKRPNCADSCRPGPQYATFRPTPLQQLVRSALHAATFGVAYIVMLLAMYYNGYIIISIFLGAFLGKFLCDWTVHHVPIAGVLDDARGGAVEEPTVCCG
ncbi:High-affinity copper transporter ctrC [Exophiala dermatitidis]